MDLQYSIYPIDVPATNTSNKLLLHILDKDYTSAKFRIICEGICIKTMIPNIFLQVPPYFGKEIARERMSNRCISLRV